MAEGQKIRIRLKAYDHQVVDESSRKIAETVIRTQAKIKGPVPLPTEIHRYTVIRGPHVHKDSREHFELRIHKRLIDIIEPTPKTVDSLMRLDLPAGVEVEITLWEGSLPVSPAVAGACAILGLDPLFVANEGKLLAFVAPEAAEQALQILRRHEYGKGAAIIGEVTSANRGKVRLQTAIGGLRAIEMLAGEQLPRIC